eukprot:1135-Heterococcus_DN1.PRE.10
MFNPADVHTMPIVQVVIPSLVEICTSSTTVCSKSHDRGPTHLACKSTATTISASITAADHWHFSSIVTHQANIRCNAILARSEADPLSFEALADVNKWHIIMQDHVRFSTAIQQVWSDAVHDVVQYV